MQAVRVLTAVVTAISLVMAPAMSADAAQRAWITQSVGDTVWGIWAIQYSSTYDGDGIIAATVRDLHRDGSCVQAVYEDGGDEFVQGTSCYRWDPHLFFDQTGDSEAWVRVNRTRHDDPEIWWQITSY